MILLSNFQTNLQVVYDPIATNSESFSTNLGMKQ